MRQRASGSLAGFSWRSISLRHWMADMDTVDQADVFVRRRQPLSD
jgi:hypothetical protein